MSLSSKDIYAGAPNTERGRCCFVNTSPDGKQMIYGSGNNVILREVENPLRVFTYAQHSGLVRVARFAPQHGLFVASADDHGHVRVWNLTNEQNTLKLEKHDLTKGVRDLQFTGDAKRLLVVGEGRDKFGVAFSLETGTSVGELTTHSKEILSVDCRQSLPIRAITTGEDYQISFYRGPPFKFEKSLQGHEQYVNCVRCSPDGSKFCTVGSDKTICFYDGKEGSLLFSIPNAHDGSIYSVSWSPDGTKIITSSADKTVKLWNVEDQKAEQIYKFEKHVNNMQLGTLWSSVAGPMSISLQGDISYLDPDSSSIRSVLRGHSKNITGLIHDNVNDISYSSAHDGVLVWKMGEGSTSRITSETTSAVALLSNSKQLVLGNFRGELRFVSTDSLEYPKDAQVSIKGTIERISVDDSGVLVCTTNKGLAIVKDQQLVKEVELSYKVHDATVRPDGQQIAVAAGNRKVYLYNFNGSDQVTEQTVLEYHDGEVERVKYSPDGKLLASGDSCHEIVVWNTEDNSILYKNLSHHTAAITGLAFHPNDNNILCSCAVDGALILWNLSEKKRCKIGTAHPLGVDCLCFIEGGESVLSAGRDWSLKTWSYTSE